MSSSTHQGLEPSIYYVKSFAERPHEICNPYGIDSSSEKPIILIYSRMPDKQQPRSIHARRMTLVPKGRKHLISANKIRPTSYSPNYL